MIINITLLFILIKYLKLKIYKLLFNINDFVIIYFKFKLNILNFLIKIFQLKLYN